jgi:hypothetical protein
MPNNPIAKNHAGRCEVAICWIVVAHEFFSGAANNWTPLAYCMEIRAQTSETKMGRGEATPHPIQSNRICSCKSQSVQSVFPM